MAVLVKQRLPVLAAWTQANRWKFASLHCITIHKAQISALPREHCNGLRTMASCQTRRTRRTPRIHSARRITARRPALLDIWLSLSNLRTDKARFDE